MRSRTKRSLDKQEHMVYYCFTFFESEIRKEFMDRLAEHLANDIDYQEVEALLADQFSGCLEVRLMKY